MAERTATAGTQTNKVKPWHPQPGPQTALLGCPVKDIFFGGARGGGKTSGLLGHYLHHWMRNPNKARGVIFRRTYPELEEVIFQAKEMYSMFNTKFVGDKPTFTFPDGATLRLRHLDQDSDADNYQGHQYNWIAFDELPNWPRPDPVDKLRACLRDPHGVPCFMLSSGNPGGVGHNWVKDRYIDAGDPGIPFQMEQHGAKIWRIFIPSKLSDNQILMRNDPSYVDNLKMSGPDWLVKAWLDGDWDVSAGGYLSGAWDSDRNIVDDFKIPVHWRHWRALDWGYKAPYSVGWYTQDYDGVIYRYRELYGYGGKPNVGSEETADVVAKQIRAIEAKEIKGGVVFQNNPADLSIWGDDGRGNTIYSLFYGEKVGWVKCRKGPRSRVSGAQVVATMLSKGQFKVFRSCRHFIRTVPAIPSDPRNLDDVDTHAEDHVFDEVKYSLVSRHALGKPPTSSTRPKQGTFDHLISQDDDEKKSIYKRH